MLTRLCYRNVRKDVGEALNTLARDLGGEPFLFRTGSVHRVPQYDLEIDFNREVDAISFKELTAGLATAVN
jgi:hypothetical protein